ncbi:hypothetical protein CMEL01_12446 [Colletotrichum melonis]|uniref:Uncharacterized protein n=1 Tax=Colletotrichum melonis TaxID=1209925 RepID=A0AAI9UUP3_9PEZI|nr:hypothetical protein CMEL01_12446 [Colletotrichum melonis]
MYDRACLVQVSLIDHPHDIPFA